MSTKPTSKPASKPSTHKAKTVVKTKAAPALFDHPLCKRDVYSMLRALRDELAVAGRTEVTHADALLAILPPV